MNKPSVTRFLSLALPNFSIKSKRANDVDLSFLKPYCALLRMFDFSINSVSLLSNNFSSIFENFTLPSLDHVNITGNIPQSISELLPPVKKVIICLS